MALRVFRACRRIHARLDGAGANRVGGRWNSPGRPMVYMAQSISLAVLENLVHMSRRDFPTGYVAVAAVIPNVVDVGIPLKPITDSAAKPITIPEGPDQASERSDAGSSIVRGTDRLRQEEKIDEHAPERSGGSRPLARMGVWGKGCNLLPHFSTGVTLNRIHQKSAFRVDSGAPL
jgi:RES domain-containing protein